VQHHHTHLASVLAEHGVDGPAVGVCFDGTGLGTDGAIWGGEFLVGDARGYVRAAHLAYVPLPAGAIREPWRMAVSHLLAAGCSLESLAVPPAPLRTVQQLIEQRVGTRPTSSMGRLFDAVASLVDACQRVSFDGEAPMRLEALAASTGFAAGYPVIVEHDLVQTAPLIAELARDASPPARVARRFHTWVVDMIVTVATQLASRHRLDRVALSGGVFLNRIVADEASERLRRAGLFVLRHRLVPPNDGGLSLGQLAVAARRDG
jgi:hydrogenase maturation protein HypF